MLVQPVWKTWSSKVTQEEEEVAAQCNKQNRITGSGALLQPCDCDCLELQLLGQGWRKRWATTALIPFSFTVHGWWARGTWWADTGRRHCCQCTTSLRLLIQAAAPLVSWVGHPAVITLVRLFNCTFQTCAALGLRKARRLILS